MIRSPVSAVASRSHNPLGECVGDRLYGRGATEVKGAVVSMPAAVRALVGNALVYAGGPFRVAGNRLH